MNKNTITKLHQWSLFRNNWSLNTIDQPVSIISEGYIIDLITFYEDHPITILGINMITKNIKNRESGEHCIVGYGVLCSMLCFIMHILGGGHTENVHSMHRMHTTYCRNSLLFWTLSAHWCLTHVHYHHIKIICLCDVNESALKQYECSYYTTARYLHFNLNWVYSHFWRLHWELVRNRALVRKHLTKNAMSSWYVSRGQDWRRAHVDICEKSTAVGIAIPMRA